MQPVRAVLIVPEPQKIIGWKTMALSVSHSFHHELSGLRAGQIDQTGWVKSEPRPNGNRLEEVRKGGEAAVKRLVDGWMVRGSRLVVLIHAKSAERLRVLREIRKAREGGCGLLSVRFHSPVDRADQTCVPAADPFGWIRIGGTSASSMPVRDPVRDGSRVVGATILGNVQRRVEEAVAVREASR